MTVRYKTDDNKYVQYIYVSTSTTVANFTNVNNWEKTNLEKELNVVSDNFGLNLNISNVSLKNADNILTKSFKCKALSTYTVKITLNSPITAASQFGVQNALTNVEIEGFAMKSGETEAVIRFNATKDYIAYVRFYNNSYSGGVTSCNIEVSSDIISLPYAQSEFDYIDASIYGKNIPIVLEKSYLNKDSGRKVSYPSGCANTDLILCKYGDVFSYTGTASASAASAVFYDEVFNFLSSEQYSGTTDITISDNRIKYVRFGSLSTTLIVSLKNNFEQRLEKIETSIGEDVDIEKTIFDDTVELGSGNNILHNLILKKGFSYKANLTLNAAVQTASWFSFIDNQSSAEISGRQVNVGETEPNIGCDALQDTNAALRFYNNSSSNVTSCRVVIKEKQNLKSKIGNPLYGKKISVNGDSICYGAGYKGGYAKIIAFRNDMAYQNIGVAGGTIAAETYSGSNPKHWISRTIVNMDADADYAILEGGVNDASTNIPLGSLTQGYTDQLDDTTFYGAMESILKQLIIRFSGKKIGFVIVHQMTNNYRSSNPEDTSYYWAIIKCCNKWGVPYCDLNTTVPPFGYLRNNADLDSIRTAYTKDGDGWHPNEAGYKKYYCDKIEEWMKSL